MFLFGDTMSIKIKQSILILGVLVALAVVVGYVLFAQKQSAEARVEILSGRVSEYEAKAIEQQKKLSSLQADADSLRKDLDQRNNERDGFVKKVDDAQLEITRLNNEIQKTKKAQLDWDEKLTSVRRERDELIKQVMDLKSKGAAEKIVEKIVYRDSPAEAGQNVSNQALTVEAGSDLYWAGVVRQKAALELELKKLKEDLSKSNLVVSELKKSNSDVELELGRVKNERDEIVRKIKYGEDLADNLSVELARARNEQKMTGDRFAQIGEENQQLRQDVKQLTTTKVALEKSIAGLSEEKNVIEKKLVETENIIQSRIDEIWQIKKDIDKRFEGRNTKQPAGEVELAPIVVNKEEAPQEKVDVEKIVPAVKVSVDASAKTTTRTGKIQGSIVSLNEDNNFVIIDQGEKTGIKVGDSFKVYHKGTVVGTIEVIQVRQDIAAADIKQKTSALSVGDIVK